MSNHNNKLFVFDVDGVLLDNSWGGFKDILVILGKEKEVQWIDAEYQKRKHLGPWGLEQLANLYDGFNYEFLKTKALEYCRDNLMSGAEELIKHLKKNKYIVGAISSNPQFIMDALADLLNMDFSVGTKLGYQDNLATGKIDRKVDRYIKPRILAARQREWHINRENVVVVGDSLTDVPIGELAGCFIAFNAKPEAKEKADIIIEKKDLRELIEYL